MLRIRRFWAWSRDFLRKARGLFPLTVLGALAAALSALALWFEGLGQLDMVLLAAGFIGGVLVLLETLLGMGVALAVHFGWKRASTRRGLALECGTPQETGFVSPVPRWLPLLEHEWAWESPGDVEVRAGTGAARRREVVVAHRRGVHESVCRRVTLRGILGIASITWRVEERVEVRFLPARGALDQMSLLEGLAGGEDFSDPRGAPEGDRVDMRQYVHGDSPRMILWKVYARTRKLLVRVPEWAITAKPRSCAYLVAGRGDEPGAGLMRVLLERGFLGESWRFGADGNPAFTGRLDEALDLLIRSGNAPLESPTGFPEFIQRAQKDGYSACVLVLPPVEGPWVPAVAAAIASSLVRVHAFTVVDKVALEAKPEKAVSRLLYLKDESAAPRAEQLARMARPFVGRPFPFLLVDRQAGRVFGDVRALAARRKKAQGGRT